MNTVLESWRDLIFSFTDGRPQLVRFNLMLPCVWDGVIENKISIYDLGFSKMKLSRWYSTYVSKEEVLRFKNLVSQIKKRKGNFVASFRFGNRPKVLIKNQLRDFCLMAATFNFINGKLKEINIFYRTTELITRFLLDIIILDKFFREDLEINLDGVKVNFIFSKAYIRGPHYVTFFYSGKLIWGDNFDIPNDKIKKLVSDILENKINIKYNILKKITDRIRIKYAEKKAK